MTNKYYCDIVLISKEHRDKDGQFRQEDKMIDVLLNKYGFGPVSGITIAGMIFTMVISIGVPIALLLIWRMKTKANTSLFFIGAVTFILFAILLEGAVNRAVLGATGTALTENVWLYALYGGLAAGVFEEVGRFITIKIFMTEEKLNKRNSIMLGIGHGGIESIVLVGISEIANLLNVWLINNGGYAASLELLPEDQVEITIRQASALWNMSGYEFWLGGVERLATIAFHICLSYLVYRAVSDKAIIKLLAAIGCHFLLDAGMVLISSFAGVVVTEILLVAASTVLTVFTIRTYRAEKQDDNSEGNV